MLQGIAWCVLAVGSAGCMTAAEFVGSKALDYILEPKPTRIEASFEASPDVNPTPNMNADLKERASPLWVRFYVLESLSVFENTDYYALREKDRELLAGDIKVREVIHFRPAEKRQLTFSIKPEESPDKFLYVGVVANYRNIDNAEWRAAIEIPSKKKTHLFVYLDRLAVYIQKKKREEAVSEGMGRF